MASNIRARRVGEPSLVQRGPSPERYGGSLTAMSSAWKQLGQAKSVLRRAENRIEDAENFKMDTSRNGSDEAAGRYMLPGGVSLSSRRHDREPSDRSVLMDHIPSYQITATGYPESTTDYRSRDRFPRDRPEVTSNPAHRKVSRRDGKYTDHLYQPTSRTSYTTPGLTSDLTSDLTRPQREYRSRSPVGIPDRSKRVEFRDPLESYRSAVDPKSSLHGSSDDIIAGNSGYGSAAYGTTNMAPTYTVTDLSRNTRDDRADSSVVESSTNVKVLNDTSARVGAEGLLLDGETTSPSRLNHSGALFSSARDRIRAEDRYTTDTGTGEHRTTSDMYSRGISNVTNLLPDRADIGSPVAQSTQKSPPADRPPDLYRPDEMSAEALTRTKSPVRKFEVVQRKKKELGGSDGLEKLKERIRKQRKEAGAEDVGSIPARRGYSTEREDLSARRLHSAEEPVTLATRGEEPYRSEVRSEVTPRIRKIKTAPPPPEYKGFSAAATKYRTQDGKVVTETELAQQQGKGHTGVRGQGSREAAVLTRKDKTKAKPRPAPRPVSAAAPKSPKPQRKVGAPQAAKTSRPSKKGIITTSAWREGQKAALKVLGPPPKLPKRSYSPPTKDTQTSTASESSSVAARKAAKEERTMASDKDMSSDDDLSQHPLEDLSQDPLAAMDDGKAPNTDVLSKEARGVFDDLQLDKSDDDDSSTLKSEQPAAPDKPAAQKPAAQNKPSNAAKRKASKASPVKESELPATKLRHYDHSEVRRYMNKKRNERQRKLKEQREAQKKAEEEKQKMLDELDKKRREGWREHLREERKGKPKGSTFVKPTVRDAELPKRHPFHEDRRPLFRPVVSEESDKENAGRRAERPWSGSSASVSSEDRTPVVTPEADRSPEPPAAGPSRTSAPPVPSVTTTTVPPATTGPSISIRGIPSGPREAAAPPERPISFHDAYIEQLHGKQPDVSSVRAGGASLSNGGYGVLGSRPYSNAYSRYPIGGYRSTSGRSKAERIAALQATAESLQDRIETEARRIVEGLEGKEASPPGAGRWAYSRAETSPRQQTGVLPGTAASSRDYTAFTGDLPGVSSITQHAADSERDRQQVAAATKIQAAYRGHHVRQALDWSIPSGRPAGGARANLGLSAVDEETRSNTSSLSEGRLSGGSLSEGTLTDSTVDSTRHEQPPGRKIADTLSKPEFCASTKKESQYKPLEPWKPREDTVRRKYPWEEPRGDSLSVINIYTRQYEEARKARHAQSEQPKSRTPSPRTADPYRNDLTSPRPDDPYRNPSPRPDEYEDDFTSSATSRPLTQHGSRGSGYRDDRLHPTNGAKGHSYGSERGHGSLSREPVGSSLHSEPIGREGTGRSSHYSRSAQDKDEDTLNSSLTLSSEDEQPSQQRQPLHSQSSRSHTDPSRASDPPRTSPPRISDPPRTSPPRISDPPRTSPPRYSPVTIDLRSRSPIDGARRKTPSPTDGGVHRKTPSPIEGGTRRGVYSPTEGAYRRTPSPVEGRRDFGTSRYDRDVPRSSFRPLPTSGSYSVGSRYSPSTLGNRMAAELNYLESVEESVRQLGDVERTRGVGMAQQESVSLAQILKARQQQHEREMAELTMKARQEAVEASRQLEDARRKAASTAAEAAQAIAHVRNEASSTINESARKLMETQAEATRATAEAAKQLAEAKTASLEQTSALQAHDAGRLATETATAAATAAVTAAMEQQNRQQEQLLKTLQQGSQPYRSRDPRDRPRPDTRSSYSSSYTTDYDSSKTSPAKTSLSKTPPSVEDKLPAKTRPRSPHKSEEHTDSISEDIPTASDQSQKALGRHGNDTQSSIGEELPSGAADVSKDESIAEEIPEDKVSVSGSEYSYSMKFDESLTESEMEEMSFKMLLPSESHRRRSIGGKKQKTPEASPRDQSDAASYSSDELHSTVGSGKFTFEGASSPFSAEDSFSHFMSDMVQQYMHEEEVRARHQASLLRLREKALKEKTKAELDWLEHQKKRLRDKGADDSMPPIRKRQRGLMLRLQTEQAEIKRLREANKAASRERQLLFMQQQEIMKMRQSTAAIREKIRHRKKDAGASDEEIPEELSDKLSPADRSAVAGPGDVSADTPRDRKDSVSDAEAKMLQKLKKMHDPKDERYLTTREQKLQHRKKNAEDLLAWKQQLDAEEKKVRSLERQALSVWGQDVKGGKDKSAASPQPKVPASPDSVVTESAATAADPARTHRRSHSNQSESSIAEEVGSRSSSIPEEIGTESNGDKPRPHDVSSDDTGQNSSIGEEYSNSFESPDTARTASKGPVRTPPPPKLDLGKPAGVRTRESLVSPRSQKVPGKRRESESGSEGESNPHTPSETASDQSDIEGRIRALNQELKQRKMVAERLKKEAKRRTREKLKAQEEALRKQLEAYDMFIKKTTEDLEREQREAENVVKPQIKQPRPAESPRRLKTPPDISPRSQSDLTRWKQRSESESSRSSKSSFEEESAQKDHTDSIVMPTPSSIQPTPRSPAEEKRLISPLPSPTRPEKLEEIRPRRLEGIHLELSRLEPAEKSPRDTRSSVSSIAEEIPTEPSSARTAQSEGSELSPRVKHVMESPKLAKELEEKSQAQQQVKKKPEAEDEPESDSSQKSDHSFTSYSTSASRQSQRTRTVSEKSSDQSYSDDFEGSQRSYRSRSDRSPSVTSEEEISEHFSGQSARSTASSQQSRHELFIDLKTELGTPSKTTEETAAESDEDRTPVASPAETPTPRDRRAEIDTSTPIIVDPLAEYKLGDNVIVDGDKAGVLRFKGPTSFAPGMWAGVELRKAIGDCDGSRGGMRYFSCAPDRGVFSTPDNLKPALEEYTSESSAVEEIIPEQTDRTDSDVETPRLKLDFAESEKDFAPRRERTYSDDFDTPRSIPESRERSQKDEEPDSEQISLHSSDSELEKAISSAAAAVESFALESPEDTPRGVSKDLAETPRDASDLPKDSSEEKKDKLVDDITDDLASMVLQDSLSCITNLAESRQAEAEELDERTPTSSPRDKDNKPHTPLLDLLLREHEIQQRRAERPPPAAPDTSPEVTPRQQAEKFSESLVTGLFSDAISDILNIRKHKQRIRTSSDKRRPDVVTRLEETRDQDDSLDDELNELQLPSSPLDPVPRPNSPVELHPRPGSPVELHPRPGSPVFGEKLDEFQAQLDDILSTDQTWFEEDGIFGLGNRGAQKGQGASKRSPESQEPPQSQRTSPHKLDLQKVTDDVFFAIPHNEEEVRNLVKSSVQVFHNNREYGDDLAPIATPRDLLSNDTPGNDIESLSKRSYKKIIFDLSGEIFKDIYAEENVETPPVWMKPKKSQRKHFRRRPPGGLEELTSVIQQRVLVLLGLQPSKKLQHTTKFLKMGRKKKDQVDEILIEELATEEPEWVNYDDDELAVKLQLSDSIFENLLSETVQLVSDISLRKVGSHAHL